MVIAVNRGPSFLEIQYRVDQLIELWREPIPGQWERGKDSQLLGARYRRGDFNSPRNGEHAIEKQILHQYFDRVQCCGCTLLDGVNAVPLVRDPGGGRNTNVEADMFLLGEQKGSYRLFLCEVKHESNNAWSAAVENVRQLRLLLSSRELLGVFRHRNPAMDLPSEIPVSALVVAPRSFYSHRGQKANAVQPALSLLEQVKAELGVNVRLGVWDPPTIKDFVDASDADAAESSEVEA
jgi:hypothetical protein